MRLACLAGKREKWKKRGFGAGREVLSKLLKLRFDCVHKDQCAEVGQLSFLDVEFKAIKPDPPKERFSRPDRPVFPCRHVGVDISRCQFQRLVRRCPLSFFVGNLDFLFPSSAPKRGSICGILTQVPHSVCAASTNSI